MHQKYKAKQSQSNIEQTNQHTNALQSSKLCKQEQCKTDKQRTDQRAHHGKQRNRQHIPKQALLLQRISTLENDGRYDDKVEECRIERQHMIVPIARQVVEEAEDETDGHDDATLRYKVQELDLVDELCQDERQGQKEEQKYDG